VEIDRYTKMREAYDRVKKLLDREAAKLTDYPLARGLVNEVVQLSLSTPNDSPEFKEKLSEVKSRWVQKGLKAELVDKIVEEALREE